MMSLTFFASMLSKLALRWLLFLYAAARTILVTATVAVVSFWPEITFVPAISPSSSFSRECESEAFVRVPLGVPGEIFCLPSQLFKRSKIDMIIPPVFAALVVAGSAWVVRALGLFENDELS